MITELGTADLIVDEVYGGSRNGNASDDPLPGLLGVDNGAGFRHLGKRPEVETLNLLALKSSFQDPDWPDHVDQETGICTYYGDKRKPGNLHDTPRQGNSILKNLFEAAHDKSVTKHFPPIFLFGSTGVYRDVRFLGLVVPSSAGLSQDEDLVAVWRSSGNNNVRFQNYRAKFTILDVPVISRSWIDDVKTGNAVDSLHVPQVWLEWVRYRRYKPLQAKHSLEIRTPEQQLPQNDQERKIIEVVKSKYRDDPIGFEKCALEVAKLIMPSIFAEDLTRPSRDGGRDAVGLYKIGAGRSSIAVEFALEAKCFDTAGVGVKPLARLISRLRHRQFGVLVTTSYLSRQAYNELVEDEHPVVVIAAIDIARVLLEKVGGHAQVTNWINTLK